MAKFSAFATDEVAEVEGKWFPLEDTGIELKLARTGNDEYTKMFRRLLAPHDRLVKAGKLPEEIAREILIKVLAYTIVKDWKGVEDDDGENLPFSPEACIAALTKYKDLRKRVMEYADAEEAFRILSNELDATTLGNGSHGKPNGATGSGRSKT